MSAFLTDEGAEHVRAVLRGDMNALWQAFDWERSLCGFDFWDRESERAALSPEGRRQLEAMLAEYEAERRRERWAPAIHLAGGLAAIIGLMAAFKGCEELLKFIGVW